MIQMVYSGHKKRQCLNEGVKPKPNNNDCKGYEWQRRLNKRQEHRNRYGNKRCWRFYSCLFAFVYSWYSGENERAHGIVYIEFNSEWWPAQHISFHVEWIIKFSMWDLHIKRVKHHIYHLLVYCLRTWSIFIACSRMWIDIWIGRENTKNQQRWKINWHYEKE